MQLQQQNRGGHPEVLKGWGSGGGGGGGGGGGLKQCFNLEGGIKTYGTSSISVFRRMGKGVGWYQAGP